LRILIYKAERPNVLCQLDLAALRRSQSGVFGHVGAKWYEQHYILEWFSLQADNLVSILEVVDFCAAAGISGMEKVALH
jgi:hypothetical protein